MSEVLSPLFDKKVICPVCTHSFTTKRLRSRFVRVDKVDTDFLTYYKDEKLNPIFYEISVCPKCGYAFSDMYSTSFPPNAIDLIKSQISANWNERNYSEEREIPEAIATYKLALLSGSLKKEKSVVMAGICLRLAWLYRMTNDEEQEFRFIGLALEKYKNSFVESDYIGTQLTEMRLLYLIGELSRRIGEREEAVKNFSRVINHKNRTFETKLVEMAREQWYLIRENDKIAE